MKRNKVIAPDYRKRPQMVRILARRVRMLHYVTKIRILMTIFASGAWDSIRREYIESCKLEYEQHYRRLSLRGRAETCLMPALDSRILINQPFDMRRTTSHDKKTQHLRLSGPKERELDHLIDKGFGCPLPVMPRFARVYRRFSNIFVTYSMIKYALLASMHYGWLNIDKSYACYLPGRSALAIEFAYEMPWFGVLIFGFHVMSRLVAHLGFRRLSLDCFLFLLYDEDAILERQFEIVNLNSPNLMPEEAYKRYLCNKIFYEQHVDSRGRLMYVMKQHRTIEHYERLKSANIVFYIFCCIMIIIAIPAYFLSLRTHLSHEYFDVYYPECRSFSDSPNTGNFSWSFKDKYRLFNLIFDRLDNEVLTIDTVILLILPLVLVILTHDLDLRFRDLCKRVSNLNDRFRYISFNDDLVRDMFPFERPSMKFIEDLEQESQSIFNEVIGTFKQVRSNDEYVRKVTNLLVFIWFLVTMSTNTFLLMRLDSSHNSNVIIFLIAELYAHTAMAALLALMARPHKRAKILYNKLCSAMALCPNKPETKVTWRWLVEFYHKGSSRYSLHFVGKVYAFSNLNIIRCMSWFVSCTVIILNLIGNRLPDPRS